MRKAICVVGPTASGKTAISIELAKVFNGEIISGDSIQIYREMNIGSAKISEKEKCGIVHHMIDIKSCFDEFSAAEFSQHTISKIQEIESRGKTPIIVGGTGLFIKGLVEGYDYSSCQKNQDFRKECEQIIASEGLEKLYKMLQEVNPDRANEISSTDQKRIIRALEIEKFANDKPNKNSRENSFVVIGLKIDRDKLYEQINKRVDGMVEKGLVEEVKGLLDMGLNQSHQSMQAIGYKELLPYFSGEKSLDECIEQIKQHTRNFAKRQMTWFRKMPYINWFEPYKTQDIVDFLRSNIYDNN